MLFLFSNFYDKEKKRSLLVPQPRPGLVQYKSQAGLKLRKTHQVPAVLNHHIESENKLVFVRVFSSPRLPLPPPKWFERGRLSFFFFSLNCLTFVKAAVIQVEIFQ